MTKTCFIVTVLFSIAAASALADNFIPKVGHFATYQRTSQDGTLHAKLKIADHHQGSEGFDTYRIDRYSKQNGSWVKQGSETQIGFFIRQHFFTDVQSFCDDNHGEIETVTAASTTYNACKLAEDIDGGIHQDTWFAANVPFGVIKQVSFRSVDGSDEHETVVTKYGVE